MIAAVDSELEVLGDARFVIMCECPNKNMAVFKGQLQDLTNSAVAAGKDEEHALATSSLMGAGNLS